MKPSIVWKNFVLLVGKAVAAGLLNWAFFVSFMNTTNAATKSDEVAINTYVLNLFVGWMLFSAWFLAKVDEEWKKSAEAVQRNDFETFKIEAPKRIPPTIRVLYLVISVMTILSFHLFHLANALVQFEIQFGIGFFVVMAVLVLWDLDDPIDGVTNIQVSNEWIDKLEK